MSPYGFSDLTDERNGFGICAKRHEMIDGNNGTIFTVLLLSEECLLAIDKTLNSCKIDKPELASIIRKIDDDVEKNETISFKSFTVFDFAYEAAKLNMLPKDGPDLPLPELSAFNFLRKGAKAMHKSLAGLVPTHPVPEQTRLGSYLTRKDLTLRIYCTFERMVGECLIKDPALMQMAQDFSDCSFPWRTESMCSISFLFFLD